MMKQTFPDPPLPRPAGPTTPSATGSEGRTPFANRTWRIAVVAVATAIVGLAAATSLPPRTATAAALSIFCIGLWASAAVPEHWTALAFFLVAVLFGIAPVQTVFSGFQSSTFWLLFSGLVLGAAVRHTGLGQRAATLLSRGLGRRYSGAISRIVLFGVVLAFVMPSSVGRIVLLVPMVIALAAHMGYGPTSNGRIGMLSAAAFGTVLPAFTILPSNVPNMMLAGMAETLYGAQLAYWHYLLLHFPVLGAVKVAILILAVLWMFPDHDPAGNAPSPRRLAPMSAAERRLAAVLGFCLVFWLTDGIHHISPGWIGLAAALFCLWPGSGLTSKNCLNEDISYGTLFFVAGIMGLGAVISTTGLGEAVVQSLTEHAHLSAGRPFWNVAALTAISTLVAMLTNLPGVPAVMTPVSQDFATMTGLPLGTVLMAQVLAFSNVFLPYQAPPLVTAIQVGGLPHGAVARLCLALFAITALVLTPLDLLWWHLLGLL